MRALQLAAKLGADKVTFGVEASTFKGGFNQHGLKMRLLEKSFNAISKQFNLQQKSEFRKKLGATDDPIYICYPKGKLGTGGVRAIMRFLSDDPDNGS
jgi:aspartyl-tRNA synthetase